MKLTRTRRTAAETKSTTLVASDDQQESRLAAERERRYLEEQLSFALERGELSLYYQPQFEVRTVRLAGSEALLRWNHPVRGMISPAQFIPIAEESGLIVPIGAWVLQEACHQNYLWQQAGYDPIRVAVNVSAQQFAQVDFVSTVAKALADSRLDPRYLELELTETVLMRDIRIFAPRLANLKTLGIKLSMDDFGSGALSLPELVRLPVDSLKIDVPFVRGLNETPGTLRLVSAIVALGHSLGMNLMAEGVETEEQLKQLRQLGCDKAQGYLFSAAVPANDSEDYQTLTAGPPEQEEPR